MTKLELTDKEFETLADLVFLGNWIVNSSRLVQDIIKKYEKLTEKILKIIMQDNFDNIDNITDYYYDKLLNLMEYYDNKSYLVTLAENMARHKYPDKNPTDEDFFLNHIRQFAAKDAYESVLKMSGLDAVEIKVDNLDEKIKHAEILAKETLKDSR